MAPRALRLGRIPFFAAVAEHEDDHGDELAAVVDDEGQRVASVRRTPEGTIRLPFDPDEALIAYWSESYALATSTSLRGTVKRGLMRTYYAVRPVLPRAVQIWLRRRFSRIQARTRFPAWPVETAQHDLLEFLVARLVEVAGEPVPWIHPWPGGRSWALVLTHDVETATGRDNIHLLRDVEQELGLRSSWNFVPRRYTVDDSLVESLAADGFEVGVHGLYHDGRDLESLATLEERLPEMRAYAERWRAVGFRSPATHRRWEWMPLLGFDYDSSYPDTDPFEPQGGGCCSWLPFFNQSLVELPLTLPQDHTLFVILREDERRWVEKTAFLRERGGMALLNTHPDYMREPREVDLYRRYLASHADDPTVWHALPREVCAWWRKRSETIPVRDGDGWRAEGAGASDATIVLAAG
jgi:hypothetical protein